ncbi:lytic murein transglycosylase B [Acinetobacter sp. MD2]|uniref:lytic murein transglycosylase B n=1 Tax=Acinetobacter sp. MD2 TaxID=2600066 RepID=UPI002D1EF376|nr:lytic murein transglycosylase B [Acinetobacter sp. MD2]MEB3766171.1 lytic murein transglycosylase B [Acinetobacter sp. MD2]
MWQTKLNKICSSLALCCSAIFTTSFCQANEFVNAPSYDNFKNKTIQRYGLTADQVDQAMLGARNRPNILDIMQRPGESKPWYSYREMFLTPTTIQRGVNFRNQYADTLNRAEQQFGVPQAIILGILGVETGFGSNRGNIMTRDALATLAFNYPRRADYFSDELSALIAWSYKEGYPITSITGSYAGAVGYPQFMPSNIGKYGVDYDNNGHVDLRNSPVDAIGSIANYLAQQGWQRNQPIGFLARYTGSMPDDVIAKDLTQPTPYAILQQKGISPLNPIVKIDEFDPVNVIQLQDYNASIYYITYPNFQVITTYNKSRMYATAVWLLGTEIMAQ